MHRGFEPRSFRPAPWLRGPHAQTLGARVLRPPPADSLLRERLETPDGDFVDLDAARDPGPGHPLVLVLHGLEGSTRRRYVRAAMDALVSRGVHAVGMNFRSCSGAPNRALTFYHSGETRDVLHVLRTLRRRFPGRPVGALGYSLGGNVLLKALAEDPEAVDAAAVVSVPFDLAAGTELLEGTTMGRIYARYFLRSLLRKVELKAGRLAGRLDLERLRRVRTLREFDDVATAPLHGFDGAWDYYARASSGPVLPGIRTPTLVVHSADDPFLPATAIPTAALEGNPFLLPSLWPRGGHVGFVAPSTPRRPALWAETEAARYLAHLLDSRNTLRLDGQRLRVQAT